MPCAQATPQSCLCPGRWVAGTGRPFWSPTTGPCVTSSLPPSWAVANRGGLTRPQSPGAKGTACPRVQVFTRLNESTGTSHSTGRRQAAPRGQTGSLSLVPGRGNSETACGPRSAVGDMQVPGRQRLVASGGDEVGQAQGQEGVRPLVLCHQQAGATLCPVPGLELNLRKDSPCGGGKHQVAWMGSV